MITKRTLLIASTALAGVAALGTASLAADFTGTVTIVHINDVHAHIDGTDTQIGYPKIAGFVEQTRAENPNTLFLDAGDAIAGDPYASIDRGLGFLPILNTLGIDAMTAGNSEFAYGSDHLKTFAAGLNYPLLVDNMVYTATGEPFSEGFTLVELPNGMTAGIVGVTTHQSGVMASTDLEYVDAVAATERLVGEATEAGADFIVGLLHLGELEEDSNSLAVAEQVEGLDVIIDGNSHTGHPSGLIHNDVLIAQTSGNGETVGVVDLAFVDGKFTGAEARLLDRASLDNVPEKAATRAALDVFLATATEFFNEIVGSTDVTLEGTRDVVRTQETNLGNLFTDAVREAAGAQLAFLPAGYIGGVTEPGPIDRRTVQTMARIEVEIVKMELTGEQVVAFVDSTVGTFPESSGSLLHVSGGTYRIDPDAEGTKAHSFTVEGAPLSPEDTYSVAVVVGALSRPGISEGTLISRHGNTPQILEAYLKANSPVAPQVEGRFGAATKAE
ncbi:bifunctional UDP-sugar hydrolase/5'-nucleotidase [Gordonia sp. (in: high G+C Gram-positive bacteria)]|uniref:bifunctional metallophosphatase/5'-nucleotidase n=1 Tax=Gordonia sp. (in: high G+C Gram-positive bacteria) TaxID=84139 RepID=UPI0016B667D5|nr:bifunctional UDP-sugar hydrolase/5'-nucleotidase [Gordonia sp. (in: high G+C Gram-positive bacteria)]NLG46407.1 bifunctional metallophosphatase/5'-nucleotidase [Gordonia sp. (in: high G+C Gram-positive bacteria)]